MIVDRSVGCGLSKAKPSDLIPVTDITRTISIRRCVEARKPGAAVGVPARLAEEKKSRTLL